MVAAVFAPIAEWSCNLCSVYLSMNYLLCVFGVKTTFAGVDVMT